MEFLEALDDANLGVKVALLAYPTEYDEWRLLLASPVLDNDIGGQIGLVIDAFSNAGIMITDPPSLLILKMSDPFIKELRRTFRKVKDPEGRRVGPQSFGHRFIEDGIIYRIR